MRIGFAALVLALLPVRLAAGPLEAARYSEHHGGRVLLIWQNGRVVHESSHNGGHPDRRENLFSITKSLAALGVFAGLGDTSLDTPAARFLPEWKNHPGKSDITLRHLLNQTSGLAPGYATLYGKTPDKRTAALRLQRLAPPGQSFAYGPVHAEVLEAVLAKKLPTQPRPWLEKTLPGLNRFPPPRWRTDPHGHPYFSAGLHLSARELLPIAHLVRRRGWSGLRRLFPGSLMKQAESGSEANPMYGLGFWLNRNTVRPDTMERDIEEALAAGLSRRDWTRSTLSRKAPADLVVMAGSKGQRVYVSRSQNLIIIRLGRGGGFRDPDFLSAFFSRPES